jgi:uncharacterized protein (TIGR02453 family)
MPAQSHFSPELFRFLRQLKRNNNREWFQANKTKYEAKVRDPMLQFITDFGPRLFKISPHFVANPRPTGGSLFRVYRDTRFSKDKSPYKTVAAVQFRHEAGKDVHAPGFYLHLEPDRVFAGAGLWHPDNHTLNLIRGTIVKKSDPWKRLLSARTFKTECTLEGDSLKRPPRGFDPDHELIEDLKRKDFVALKPFTEKEAVKTDFLDRFTKTCKNMAPLVAFLTEAVGLPY